MAGMLLYVFRKDIEVITQVPSKEFMIRHRNEDIPVNEPGRINPGDLRFKAFSVLWAIAALFHMAHSSVFDSQLNLALLTLAAFFVIFRPSLTAFIILISLQLFDAFFRMPFTTNHWIFTAFVNVSLLQVLLFLMVRNQSFNINEGQFFKAFAPIVRINVIILYFFAVFHKLNSGFFTPATSCATDLLKAQHIDQIIPLSEGLFAINAYFTIIVELSIPVLLCFTRTRNAGVLIGLFFHCVLSYSTYNAFYDFSAMMFAVYFVFLNPAFSQTIYEIPKRLKSFKDSFVKRFHIRKLVSIAVAVIFFLGIIYILNKGMDTFKSVHLYFFWTIYSILFTLGFIRYMRSRTKDREPQDPLFRVLHWSFLIIPALVFLNGTLPYLGLKTENSYAMFSNLRTEGGKTNHFIVPASVQIFGYQKDVVQIISSTDPWLQQLAEENKAMVLFEFRTYVNEKKPEKIDYLVNGEHRHFLRSESDSFQTLGNNPYVLRKLMKFRPFSLEGPQPCAH